MIINLQLEKTYGSQDEDIAKKNKYGSVQIPVLTISEETIEGDISIPITTQSTDNIDTGNVWSAKDITKTSSRTLTESFIPTYIGEVLYKTYTLTITNEDTLYNYLSPINSIPEFTWTFNGKRYEENATRTDGWDFTLVDSSKDFKDSINRLVLQKNLKPNPTTFENKEYDVTKNIYQYINEEGETVSINAVDEYNESINSSFESAGGYINEILPFAAPKITEWNNLKDKKKITISIMCPYSLKIFMSDSGIKRKRASGFFSYYYKIYDYKYLEYTFTSVSVDISNNYTSSTQDTTYFSESNMYSANSSFLFLNDNNQPQNFATEIVNAYKKGKLMLDLKYPVDNVLDFAGNQVVYVENKGIASKVGDLYYDEHGNLIDTTSGTKISTKVPLEKGLLCVVTNHGETEYKNADGSNKYFVINNVDVDYSGILLNEIQIMESTASFPEYKLSKSGDGTVTRVYSDISSTGVLKNNSIIYKGDILEINFQGDIRNYEIKMDNIVLESGTNIDGATINRTITVTGPVSVSITKKAWGWKAYGSETSYWVKEFDSQTTTIHSWNKTYTANVDDNVKADSSVRKMWWVKPTYYVGATLSTQTAADWFLLDEKEISSGANGCVVGISAQDTPYVSGNEPGNANTIELYVSSDGVVSIKNTGYYDGQTGYYLNYFTEVDFWLEQYEYF